MQIDTTTNNNIDSAALYKEQMKDLVGDYMAHRDMKKKVSSMIGKSQNRLGVSLDEIRHFNPELANYCMKNPIEAISMFENQLDNTVKDMKDDAGKGGHPEKQTATAAADKAFPSKIAKYYVSFEGNFGRNHVTPRGLKSNLVGQMVSVQGIVTKMSIVKPKIQTSVHYCEATKKGLVKHYNDVNNLGDQAEDAVKPLAGNDNFPTKD